MADPTAAVIQSAGRRDGTPRRPLSRGDQGRVEVGPAPDRERPTARGALWGFIIGSGDSILGFIPINTEDNVLHAAIGVAGIAAGLASPTGAARPAAGGGPAAAH